jgi:hypothetical protein
VASGVWRVRYRAASALSLRSIRGLEIELWVLGVADIHANRAGGGRINRYMKHPTVRLAFVLFLVGALIGAFSAPVISQWIALAAPPTVRRLSPDTAAWLFLSLRAAVLIGAVFASVPIAIHFFRVAESSLRTIVLVLFTSLSVFAAALFYLRATVAAIRPAELGLNVLISPAAASFTVPSLFAIGAVLVATAFLRMVPNTPNG